MMRFRSVRPAEGESARQSVDIMVMPAVAEYPSPPVVDLFRGAHSVRWRLEKLMLLVCVVFAPVTIGLVAFTLHEQLAGTALGIFIIVAFAYTAMARGRLLGTSVHVHKKQLPKVFGVVEACTRTLGVSMPSIFVREDLRVPLVAIGLREPYALIISTVWLSQLEDEELKFLVGRELGHIYARHTRLTSLLSSTGADNPILAFVMGPWLRRTEYTADRVGLLCCGGCDAATQAILTTQFQHVAGAIDPKAFIEQRDEIEADRSLRSGEWISREPYATHRIHELELFAASARFAYWRDRLKDRTNSAHPVIYQERRGTGLPGLLVFDIAVIVLLANILNASGDLAVNLDDPDVPVFLSWIATHAPWVSQHLGRHPTAQTLSAFLTYLACFVVSLIIYIVITCMLRRTPGMFVLGLEWKRRSQPT